MIYTNAAYANPDQTTIRVDISGVTSFVPCAPGNSDYARIQELVNSGELVVEPYVPPPPPPVQEVTMRQARLVLLNHDLLDDVENQITTMSKAAQIEWEYSTHVLKTSELVQNIAQTLNLSESDVDTLFQEASQL